MILSEPDRRRLSRCAAAADAAGMLQPGQRALIQRRGWLTMLAPRACGGAELALPDAVRLEEAVAAADGSCGWVVTLCAGAGWFAGFLPPALARELIATPRVCLAGSGAPGGQAERDGDGWRLAGRWGHATGAPWATHFTLNAVLQERGQPLLDAQGQPRIRAFVVPADAVEVLPTWSSIGLRATASHAFALRGCRVPADHGFDIDPRCATADGPLYRFPFRPLAFVTLAANLAGMAGRFIELAGAAIERRLDPAGGGRIGDPVRVAAELGGAREDFAGARDRFYRLLDAAWAQVAGGELPPAAAMAALETAARTLVSCARQAVDGLYPYAGLQAADPRSELNRVWRDFHTATQHALWTV